MGLFSRKTEPSTSADVNPRTGQPYRSDAQAWEDLATDADRRAAQADSKSGRKAMKANARAFRRNAR
ncbi:MAG: hypothetical protein K0R62_6249 [Nonomuraea muscovyensis]|jgi:hypothetical protein|nr:hypothetical protein [Nonomuraea muscovyensis]